MSNAWHDISPEETFSKLETQSEGLTEQEVLIRREKYGENKLQEPDKTPAWLRFLSQYNDPLNYLLIGAALIALAINPEHPGDAIFIFLVLTANATFGFWQEGQAEQAMDALKQWPYQAASSCVMVLSGKFPLHYWFQETSSNWKKVSMFQQM